jgi:hypothetical protein
MGNEMEMVLLQKINNFLQKAHPVVAAMRPSIKHGYCEMCNNFSNARDFAHIKKTKLQGASRGSFNRYKDIRDNTDKYRLLCPECHYKFDKKLTPEQKAAVKWNIDFSTRRAIAKIKRKADARKAASLPSRINDYVGRKRQQQPIYLKPGQNSPEGSREFQGKRGGRYYLK